MDSPHPHARHRAGGLTPAAGAAVARPRPRQRRSDVPARRGGRRARDGVAIAWSPGPVGRSTTRTAPSPSPRERAAAARARGAGGGRQAEPAPQVGQLSISSFDGTTRPDYIRRRLRDGETAGVILFERNGGDAARWRRLTASISGRGARARADHGRPGGRRHPRAPFAGPEAARPLQGGAADVRAAARDAGRELRAAGVNVNLAPVADLARSRGLRDGLALVPARRRRRRGEGQRRGRGHRAGGVAATAKHFPGLGGVRRQHR